jgi:hypothetical protein
MLQLVKRSLPVLHRYHCVLYFIILDLSLDKTTIVVIIYLKEEV